MASLERLAGDRATRSKAQADDAVSCKVEPIERPSRASRYGQEWEWDAVPRDRKNRDRGHTDVPVINVYTFSGAGLPMAGSADGKVA